MGEAHLRRCGRAGATRRGWLGAFIMELDMELEAEFDAQAFGPELRALKVRVDDAGSSFVLAATVPWTAEPAPALELVKDELLREDEACFVLFRTRTWVLISFIPPDAPGPECALYDASCAKLQALLGGEPRVPNVRRWASLSEVQLDEQVLPCVTVLPRFPRPLRPLCTLPAPYLHLRRVPLSRASAPLSWYDYSLLTTHYLRLAAQVELAPPCSYRTFGDTTGATDPAAVAAYIRGGGEAPPAPPAPEPAAAGRPPPPPPPPPPAEAQQLLGRGVVLRGMTGRDELNGRRGTACEWDGAAQRMGVDVEGVGRLALSLDKLCVEVSEGETADEIR